MKRAKLNREKLIAIIGSEARRLHRKGGQESFTRLDELLDEGLGWDWGRSTGYVVNHARALVALAELADDHDLVDTAYLALQRRHGDNEEADVKVRRILEPLGVRYAACGCMEQHASDMCCDNAVQARKALIAQAASELELLRRGNPKAFAAAVADLSRRVDAHGLRKAVEAREAETRQGAA